VWAARNLREMARGVMLRRVNVGTNARALCSRRVVEMFRNFCLCAGEIQLWRGKRTRLSANGCVKSPRCPWHNVLLWDRKENGILLHENGEVHISFFLCTAHRHPDAKRSVDINIPLIKMHYSKNSCKRTREKIFFLSLFSIFQYFYRRNRHLQRSFMQLLIFPYGDNFHFAYDPRTFIVFESMSYLDIIRVKVRS